MLKAEHPTWQPAGHAMEHPEHPDPLNPCQCVAGPHGGPTAEAGETGARAAGPCVGIGGAAARPDACAPARAAAEAMADHAEGAWEPKIVAFLCNWCSYAGADLAGTSRIQYPPNVRVIRVPCSGRVDPLLILKCLQRGADGVLVSGCHPGDCHYIAGNYLARRKFALLADLLDFFGIEEGRVHFSWVSAAEGEKFAGVVKRVTESVKALGKPTRLVKERQR